MSNYFIFNGQSSDELGIKIKSKSIYGSNKPDVTLISIPGRSGDVVSSNNRIANGTVSYVCFLPAKSISELSVKMRNVRKWLYTEPDRYHWLSDSYDPSFLRKAIYNSKLDVTDQANRIGSFTVSFSVHPMRYLEEGLEAVAVSSGDSLFNPYPFTSKPYLKIYGNGAGVLTVQSESNTKSWQIANIDGYVECDSDLMSFYKGSSLKNSNVTGTGYPELEAGENTITFSGGITSIEIIPRWWCV